VSKHLIEDEGMNASQIVDAFGGNAALAEAIGIGKNAISTWRKVGIPATRVHDLAQLAETRQVAGVNLKVLLQARTPTKKRKGR
jgi:hypothetical protein